MAKLTDRLNEILEQVAATNYADADLNQIMRDVVALVEALRDEASARVLRHAVNFHKGEI